MLVSSDPRASSYPSLRLAVPRAAIALCALYFAASGTLAALQHLTFHTRARDMGIYAQILWNASQGRGLSSTLLMENTNHLAEHVAPVLWLLAPIYGLLPSPVLLVLIQQLFLAASGIPVYFWARRELGNEKLALLTLAAYFLMPAMSRIALSEFHPVVMASLPAGVMAYGAFRGNLRLAAVGALFCLALEEETALVIFGVGLSWVLMHRRRWPAGVGFMAVGLAWAVLTAFVILPAFQHRVSREAGNRAAGHYDDLKKDPPGVFAQYLQERTPDLVEWLFMPHGGLSLLAPQVLASAGPATLVLFLQDRPSTYGGHWAGAMIPLYGMATASGLAWLRRRRAPTGTIGVGVLVVASTGTFLLHSHFPGGGDFDSDRFTVTQVERDLGEAVALVPPGRVTASRRIVPHLAHRPEVWQFPPTLYAAGLRPDPARQEAFVFDLTDSQTRRVLEDLNGDTVLTRRPRPHVRQFGESVLLLTREPFSPTIPLEVTFPGIATLRGFDLEQIAGELRLRVHWEPLGRAQREVVRILRVEDPQGQLIAESIDVPLRTVLPPTRWERGQLVAEHARASVPEGFSGRFRILIGWREPATPEATALVEIFR